MIYLKFENISDITGEVLETRLEPFEDMKLCLDRVDEIIDEDPRNIYASNKYLEWLRDNRGAKITLIDKEELTGTNGWELRGTLNGEGDNRAVIVASYLESIVVKEYDNANKKRKIRITKLARKKIKDTIKTKYNI